MKNCTTFSYHACERVAERLTMDPEEVADLLDWGFFVKIGEDKNTRRVHRLFYSHDDVQCFIAIQDEKTREVVTILPVDYYETINWHIPRQFLEEARHLVSDLPAPQPKLPIAPPTTPASFKISATLAPTNSHLSHVRTANLGSWPSEPYSGSTELLVKDPALVQELKQRLTLKLRPGEFSLAITFRLGKDGQPSTLDAHEIGLEISAPPGTSDSHIGPNSTGVVP